MQTTRIAGDLDRLRVALVDLTPAQAAAANALATGSTHTEAATAAGVTRETVTRWSNHHPGFRTALDRYRRALAAEQAERALRVRGKALDVVETALDADDLTAALAVLRAVPAPDLSPATTADERLVAEVSRVAASVPPPPAPRGPDGRPVGRDPVQDLLDATSGEGEIRAIEEQERRQCVAVEQLATAAGVLDPPPGEA